MKRRLLSTAIVLVALFSVPAAGQGTPAPAQGDFTLGDFRFESGEVLPKLKLHCRTLGTPRRDAAGVVCNAVLVMHGATGSGANFLSEQFAGVLFQPGQLLDADGFAPIGTVVEGMEVADQLHATLEEDGKVAWREVDFLTPSKHQGYLTGLVWREWSQLSRTSMAFSRTSSRLVRMPATVGWTGTSGWMPQPTNSRPSG